MKLDIDLCGEGQEIKELLITGFTKIDRNFASVKKDLSIIHLKVDLLKAETSGGLDCVSVKIENLTEEITKSMGW